jgi:hypothetical protein
MDAQDDLGWITRNHHEDSENNDRDEDERHQEDEESFEQIGCHRAISRSPPKEKA